mmetsp:Transcript_27182/g.32137  ORF Transcript_27182/g.32137 Transcript_27182/m.32137 type:complete len:626 (-) Transcript_27182:326-2203(-)
MKYSAFALLCLASYPNQALVSACSDDTTFYFEVGNKNSSKTKSCQWIVSKPDKQDERRNNYCVSGSDVSTKCAEACGNCYEVWGSDQSNSVPSQSSAGINGSYLWIWDSKSIGTQLEGGADATPLSCTPSDSTGPCNLLDVFPSVLVENSSTGVLPNTLSDLPKFGRLHGMLKDPQNKYVTANIFAPGGGYIGVIKTSTKEAVALFRVTAFDQNPNERSVHLSFWSDDGSAIVIANLHGKAIERIDVTRDNIDTITSLEFNKSAGIGLGQKTSVLSHATFFSGNNAFGNPLIGSIVGSYDDADLGDMTPNNVCKENGCEGTQAMAGGRPNNLPICPVPSKNGNAYVTLGGGGLFVLDLTTTPMVIKGEYGNAVVNGAGVVGTQTGNQVFITGGVSAGSSGFDQSVFLVYSFDDTKYDTLNEENTPMPVKVFQDPGNTLTIGNAEGPANNDSGQKPGVTTRRDSHGVAATLDGKYVHIVDRIQNNVEVFDTSTYQRTTYDLVSMDGQSGRAGAAGPCYTRSVIDDASLPLNDPAPDFLEITPDGKYLMIAFRGPVPVTVGHTAQGSCPGVGIVKITNGGRSGKLVDVLRSTNVVDNVTAFSLPGGLSYTGAERSDIHSAIVVSNGW